MLKAHIRTTRSGRVVKERYPLHYHDTSEDTNETAKYKSMCRKRARRNILYLDLSFKEVIQLEEPSASPITINDEVFTKLLRNLSHQETGKPLTKRKLYTLNKSFEKEQTYPESPKSRVSQCLQNFMDDFICKNDDLVVKAFHTKKDVISNDRGICKTPRNKFGFIKSLQVDGLEYYYHPDALYYHHHFKEKKKELAKIVYAIYNERIFDSQLEVTLVWSKQLVQLPGICIYKRKSDTRSCGIELSEKLISNADVLRQTILRQLCHAATWMFDGSVGHDDHFLKWSQKAKCIFPELPKTESCDYKYIYMCTLCRETSFAHVTVNKRDLIRCAYCHGPIEITPNKDKLKDKFDHNFQRYAKEVTGFAKYVKENYHQYSGTDLKHADIMNILYEQYL